MARLITLLTDFGLLDSYVAEMKGVLLNASLHWNIIDITHWIPPGETLRGSYILSRTWHRFPRGTIHLVVIDPGVGTGRRALAVERDHHFFIGPDNGVLSPVLEDAAVYDVPIPNSASPTFHGRDVFAPVAAQIADGIALRSLGQPINDPIINDFSLPTIEAGVMNGAIVHIDRFGNLITNLPGDDTAGVLHVTLGSREVGVVKRTFGDVAPGQLVAYVGSGWTVEVAVRNGSAAEELSARVGDGVVGRMSP